MARARRSGSATLAAAVRRAGDEGGRVHPGLRLATAYTWRLMVIGVAVYLAFSVLGQFEFVAVAVFLALVATALLRPLADLLARVLPRPLAVALAVFGTLFVVMGLLALVGNAAAAEAGRGSWVSCAAGSAGSSGGWRGHRSMSGAACCRGPTTRSPHLPRGIARR